MKTLLPTFVLAASLCAPVVVHARPAAKPVKSAALICPVTGEVIPSIKAAAGHSVYKGKTYYFCCAGCKPMFDKDPAKYVHPAVAKAK
jgi:YHS domain-containing protein